MGYAARVMRGLIIDHARNRQAQKRGGQFEITSFENENVAEVPDGGELTRISEALDKCATVDAELAEFVDLKFFCGFSFAEIAHAQLVGACNAFAALTPNSQDSLIAFLNSVVLFPPDDTASTLDQRIQRSRTFPNMAMAASS